MNIPHVAPLLALTLPAPLMAETETQDETHAAALNAPIVVGDPLPGSFLTLPTSDGPFPLIMVLDGFAAIAAIVPSDVVWERSGAGRTTSSFSWRGEALPFAPYQGMGEEFANPTGPNGLQRIRFLRDKSRNANPDRAVAVRIAVQQIDEPVLDAGGDADLVWNSGEMAQIIAERRAEVGLPTVSLVFNGAGHYLSGDGSRQARNPANGKAQKVLWPATLEFLAAHLKD